MQRKVADAEGAKTSRTVKRDGLDDAEAGGPREKSTRKSPCRAMGTRADRQGRMARNGERHDRGVRLGLSRRLRVLGGGNARVIKTLPPGARLGHNLMAFRGGFRLWNVEDVQTLSPDAHEPEPKRVTRDWRVV